MSLHNQSSGLHAFAGWLLWFAFIGGLLLIVPAGTLNADHPNFIFIIGALGIWRYGVGVMHFIRGMIFLHIVFPHQRRLAHQALERLKPSHIYLMVTSFRIDSMTTAKVYSSIIKEAASCGYPATVVASVVEMSDEILIKNLWENFAPPAHVSLKIVRIPGTGKRDGLANGFRCIAKDLPDDTALVAVIDGDTELKPGVVGKSAPYFSLYPNVGALTTNETCQVLGSHVMSQWHKLRFAQRHVNMCSMGLAKRVLTLTGRMSFFRASVVTQSSFINDVENDHLKHWRLGTFRFLTGDDKSSWFSLMQRGWDTYYVPDAVIDTWEHPPDKNFFRAARQLMFRWTGNSLRQNHRATKLGIRRLGVLTYYVLWDQRISMWTSLVGLAAAIVAAFKFGFAILVMYLLWIALTRSIITALLIFTGHQIGPMYPILLYFNQIFGALMKIYVTFRLDRQSWTRQKTAAKQSDDLFQRHFNIYSARLMTFGAFCLFFAFIMRLV
ncbi:glycosyltransferase family 2 protein [Alteromonas oceanisediminis]|uniref:glycosyltransferase family 2 protein n=1 Tax=Alteromonas oceanisediminis TaxID=2836180 RepID=UPI001BD9AC2A|nr:glycosyltransferase family 2 protein [Alteromonas oceanisediminis]MBT0585626.1 glycosyltransferase [Alteromonas oceanisediminis]